MATRLIGLRVTLVELIRSMVIKAFPLNGPDDQGQKVGLSVDIMPEPPV